MPGNPLYRTPGWRTLARTRINLGRANHEPCCRCHGRLGPIRYDQPGTRRLGPTADHLDPLAHGGTHLPPLDELGVAHRTCNSRHGAHLGNLLQGIGPGSRGGNPATYTGKHRNGPSKAQKKADPTRSPTLTVPGRTAPTTGRDGAFLPAPPPHPAPNRPASLPRSSTDLQANDPEFGPDPSMFADVPWLSSLFPLPPEAVWPRLMTAPHPAAVGSYGLAAIEWIEARRAADPRVPARAKRLRWFQRLVLLRQWEHDADGQLCWPTVLLTVRRQVGKALDITTPILTSAGWSTMGGLVAGNVVFGPDGSPRRVVVAHPPEVLPAHLVTLTDGRSLVASGAHLWEVFDHQGGGRRHVLSTDELAAAGVARERTTTLEGRQYPTREYRWRVTDQGALQTGEADLPVDPYLLGVWLGNGRADSPQVTMHADDRDHLLGMIRAAGYFVLSQEAHPSARSWRATISTQPRAARRVSDAADGSHRYSDSLTARLRHLGVLNAKRIPDRYLTAGFGQRLALLRGLMDTDGTATVRPHGATRCELDLTCEELAVDALTLARSLGFQARITQGEARIDGRYISPRWRVGFSVSGSDPVPFAVPRKADRVRRSSWRKRPSIASIEPAGVRAMRCITVDAEDGMFLAGRDLVPTHNSVLLSERSMCRTATFTELAGEPQLVMQVSKDLSAAREVQRLIRLWAVDQEEAAKAAARDEKGKLPPGYRPSYVVRGTHGQEEIELPDSSRYMIRGRDSVYSYSVSEAELDEAWGVRPEIVFDGLEPTMAERELSQLDLTSTAHPRTTALVPGQRELALLDLFAPGVDSTLIVEWSAHSSWDPHSPVTWRDASPHWDARQERVVSRAHSRWVRGEEDEETRAAGGFPFQYLNMWPAPKSVARWLAGEVWAGGARPGLVVPRDRAVLGVSLDSGSGRWPVVVAGQVEGGIAVGWVGEFGSLEEALAAAAARKGSACSLLAPRGLRGHAVLRGVRETPLVHEGDVTAAQDLCAAWLAAGRLLHDAGDVEVSAAVLARPKRRESGRFDGGTLALLCAWWAGRERPRSAAA